MLFPAEMDGIRCGIRGGGYWAAWAAVMVVITAAGLAGNTRGDDTAAASPRLILVHYMPWFEADAGAHRFGWHWTMNKYDPNVIKENRREIASKYYPAIGPYDSGDPDAIEYHLQLMKIAGIDGAIVDWYGIRDLWDYGVIHRNTGRFIEKAGEYGLMVAICYEDKTIPNLVKEGRIAAGDRVSHAVETIDWLGKHWFSKANYVRVGGKPLLMSFGYGGLDDAEWSKCLAEATGPVAYFSEHNRRSAAVGGYDWPIPQDGLASIERFQRHSKDWPTRIPVAFPRFDDIYSEAGVGANLGHVPDQDGATFRSTLETSQHMAAPAVQLVTWNDWGEGTMIEPSLEYGTRDLEAVQQHRRRHIEPVFAATKADLELPRRLFELRRGNTRADGKERLDRIADLLRQGKYDAARAELKAMETN
jgi:hypothetical protein